MTQHDALRMASGAARIENSRHIITAAAKSRAGRRVAADHVIADRIGGRLAVADVDPGLCGSVVVAALQ